VRHGSNEPAPLEGGLLKAHLLRYGRLPAWNSIGGSRRAAQAASADDDTLDLLTGRLDSLLVARRPLRELSAQPRLAWLENWLHTARFTTVARCLTGASRSATRASAPRSKRSPRR
jgi:hypothetical protein